MNSLIVTENTNTSATAVNEIRRDLSQPITLINKEVALSLQTIYYSWRNITSAYNNNSFSYIYNGTTYPVNIPDGFYLISDINNYLEFTMGQNNHYVLDADGNRIYFISIQTNETYYRVEISCDKIAVPSGGTNPNALVVGSTMQLVIPNTNFKKILGFTNATYPTTPSTSNYSVVGTTVPIISSVSSVIVTCNLANNEYNRYRDIISVFTPSDTYGKLLKEEPKNLIWYSVFDGSYNSVSIKFYDQDYNPLQLLDKSSCTCNLVFRRGEK